MAKITARNAQLPENMKTWKQYTIQMLKDMPQEEAEQYRKKFKTSIKFWRKRGGCLDESIIEQLDNLNIKYRVRGLSKSGKRIITLTQTTPDDTTSKILAKTPSWKRMCMCILKNDIKCEYMGF
jgi:predicted phosphoadenosine phosphosulfate sulfurtransferase